MKQNTWKPATAGIINIVVGAVGIVTGAILIVLVATIARLGFLSEGILNVTYMFFNMLPLSMLHSFIQGLGAIPITLGIISLVGGILAIKRKRWGLTLAGSVLSILVFTPLGILSTILISLSKNEFE